MINIGLYEDGIEDIPYCELLWNEDKPIPEVVADFISKTIFKGVDRAHIRELYYGLTN